MDKNNYNIKLTTPSVSEIVDPRTECDVAETRQWVNNLPLADPLSAIEAVYNRLYKLNRQLIPENRLSTLAIIYFTALKTIIINCDTGGLFNASGHQKLIIALQKLTTEQAYLIKRTINHGLLIEDKVDPLLIYLAIKALSFQLTFSYTAYLKEPVAIWREIYELYELSLSQNTARELLTQPLDTKNSIKRSVEDAFKHIILLKLLDPYHLSAKNMWDSFTFLCAGSTLCSINKASMADLRPGSYLIDSNQPGYFPVADGKPTGKNLQYIIQTAKLNISISKYVKSGINKQGVFNGINKKLLMTMATQWHQPSSRKKPRKKTSQWMQIAFGVEAVNYFLKDNTAPEIVTSILDASYEPPPEQHFKLGHCRLVDTSAGGMKIELESNNKQISVPPPGKLIYIRENDNDIHPSIGMICWSQKVGSNRCFSGINLLAGNVRAVNVKPIVSGRDIHIMQPGLVLERFEANSDTLLIIERGIHYPECDYAIEDAGKGRQATSQKAIESTDTFDCVRIQFKRDNIEY